MIVKIESLKEVSKLSPPADNMLDKIKILIKKHIKIKKDKFRLSLLILFDELKIFWSIIIFGVTSLNSSRIVDLKSIYILINLTPFEFEIKDPPIIVKKIKNKKKLFGGVYDDIPELLMLLTTFKKILKNETFPIEKKRIKLNRNIPPKIKISS